MFPTPALSDEVATAQPADTGRRVSEAVRWGVGVALALCAVVLVAHPRTPDLAAQTARADLAGAVGQTTWWTGWFGGLTLPTYSLLVPLLMAAVGPLLAGVGGVLLGSWATGRLAESALRPRVAASALAVTQVADLAAGRVTFAVGAGLSLAGLVAVRAHRGPVAALLLAAGCLASPLAGFFTGIALAAVAIAVPALRRLCVGLAGELLVIAAALAWLFPGTGQMPMSAGGLIVPGLSCLLLHLACRDRVIRRGTLLVIALLPVLLVVPSAVGSNIDRITWVFAFPLLVGWGRLPRRFFVLAVVFLVFWPVRDLTGQLRQGREASASLGFYRPLLDGFAEARRAAGPATNGQRLEVVLPESKWAVVALAGHASLARGWDRQADVSNNPIFYDHGALTGRSYRRWLDELAVGWVALPRATLDSSARAEGALVGAGLPYLQPVHTTTNWTLYRVRDAAPLADRASVRDVGPTTISLRVPQAGSVRLRVRWTPYLVVHSPSGARVGAACVQDDNGWTRIAFPRAGDFDLTSRFDVSRRASAGC